MASQMLGVSSRSLRRRLQRKSFSNPSAFAFGPESLAGPGLSGFYTILFPFLLQSTLKSMEGSCHGAWEREHRVEQTTKGWFRILHHNFYLPPTYTFQPCVYFYGPLAIYSIGCPDPASTVFYVEMLLYLKSPTLDDWLFPLVKMLLWLCEVYYMSIMGTKGIVGVMGTWASAPHVSVTFPFAAAVSSHQWWPELLL